MKRKKNTHLKKIKVFKNWFKKIVVAPFRFDRSGRGKKWRGDITLHWILCGGDGWGQFGFDQNDFALSISFVVVFRVWCKLEEDTFSFMKSVLRVRLWFLCSM